MGLPLPHPRRHLQERDSISLWYWYHAFVMSPLGGFEEFSLHISFV